MLNLFRFSDDQTQLSSKNRNRNSTESDGDEELLIDLVSLATIFALQDGVELLASLE